MSLEIRCTCGWRCQASEYYLGDRVTCPDCGDKVFVHGRSGVPYGYAPYSTWRKRVPLTLPQPRPFAPVPSDDPYAGAAFWLGFFALIAALSGVGVVLGLILAAFSIRYAAQSGRWNRLNKHRGHGKACAGLVLSIMTIVSAASFFGSLIVHDHFPCREKPPVTCIEQLPVHRPPADLRDLSEQLQRIEAEQQERKRTPQYRYPVEPRPPVTPDNEFERYQSEYSARVREERAAQENANGYRYK